MATFPILNSQELQRILAELEIIQPDMTFQQIPKTSYGSIYYALLYKLLGAKHPFPQPPQGYQDFSKIYIYTICRKHFPKFNITDLCIADILNPSAQRFQAHLSGIVNFIRLYLKYQLILKQYISSANQQQNENDMTNIEQNKSQEIYQHNATLLQTIKQIRDQMKPPLEKLHNQCNHYLKKAELIKQINSQLQQVNSEKQTKQQLLKEKYQEYQKMLDEVPTEVQQYLQDQAAQLSMEQKEKEIEKKQVQLQELDKDILEQQKKLKQLEECSKVKSQADEVSKQNSIQKINILETQIQQLQRLKEALIDFNQYQASQQGKQTNQNISKVQVTIQSPKIPDAKVTELTVMMKHLITQTQIQAKEIQQIAKKDIKNVIMYQK